MVATWYNCCGGSSSRWSCPIRTVTSMGNENVFQEFHLLQFLDLTMQWLLTNIPPVLVLWFCLQAPYCPLSMHQPSPLFHLPAITIRKDFTTICVEFVCFYICLFSRATFARAFSRLRFIASLFFALFARYSGSSWTKKKEIFPWSKISFTDLKCLQ